MVNCCVMANAQFLVHSLDTLCKLLDIEDTVYHEVIRLIWRSHHLGATSELLWTMGCVIIATDALSQC